MAIKDIGGIKDVDGTEVRIGWETTGALSFANPWQVYLRFKDSWWIKQEDVKVLSSLEVYAWVKEKIKKGENLRKNKSDLF